MSTTKIHIRTNGEKFYSITDQVRSQLPNLLRDQKQQSGILYLFVMHTSCALLITESYDPSAQEDMEAFLQYLAPRNLPFIRHTLEGPDDSPSHMKSLLLHQNLAILVEEGEMVMGRWQGLFLAEFREEPKNRSILLKFLAG